MSEFDPQELNLSRFQRQVRRIFPERRLMLRSEGTIRQVTLTSTYQVGLTLVAIAFFGWVAYATAALVWMDDIIAAKDERILDARDAYKSLLAEVSVYKEKVAEVTRGLRSNHAQFSRLVGSEGAEEGDVKVPLASETLAEAGTADFLAEQRRADRERLTLMAQLELLEQGMDDLSQARLLLTDFDGIELEMRKVVLQRDLALSENQELSSRVKSLEDQMLDMEQAQVMLVERFGEMAQEKISALEVDLKATGLNINALIDRKKQQVDNFGQGGPFLPIELPEIADEGFDQSLATLNDQLDRWGSLNELVLHLPLATPLSDFTLTSRFGVRRDPVNGRMSRHEGLDMAAGMGTEIHATGPGKVVYAGWRGRYGRVVEIDHGMGLVTRYAHMRSMNVTVGQTVKRMDVVGAVGNSGRSTGAHLHYEVRVNGKPRNPAVFLKAGKNVFEG